jgi:hypothetical protein
MKMQRKSTKKTRGANAAEKAYHGWCKEQRCVCCTAEPVEAHHCDGATSKTKVDLVTVLIGHWFVIPLCGSCHWLYHNNKSQFTAVNGKQHKLWRHVMNKYDGDCPSDVCSGIEGSNI